MLARAAAIWLLLLAIAMLAGVLRTALLVPRLGEQIAHVCGTLAVAVLFASAIWFLVRWIDPALNRARLLGVGIVWLVATVAFEFLFGHFVVGHSWRHLLADYDMAAGRLWPLVLATLVVMPALTAWLRRR